MVPYPTFLPLMFQYDAYAPHAEGLAARAAACRRVRQGRQHVPRLRAGRARRPVTTGLLQHSLEHRGGHDPKRQDRKSTRLNSSHLVISYAVFCLKKKKKHNMITLKASHSVHQDMSRSLNVTTLSITVWTLTYDV